MQIRELFPCMGQELGRSDDLAALIPDELSDWRPTDPSGGFCFSLAEHVMQIADTRRLHARQLAGERNAAGLWCTSRGPLEDGRWEFRAPAHPGELLTSLRDGRAELEYWLDQPAERMLEVTPGCSAAHAEFIAWLQQHELPTAHYELLGASPIQRLLTVALLSEAASRGALEALLQTHGIRLPEE